RCVAGIAERKGLIVKCAPGAGRGAPGCFLPELATVELDGKHLGVKPRTCRPRRPSDRERYPALWGVLVHEAAHADTPDGRCRPAAQRSRPPLSWKSRGSRPHT